MEKRKKFTVDKDKTLSALKKKAFGYDYTETVEDYSLGENGELLLTKKKVTVKNVPPDVTAIKMLMDLTSESSTAEFSDEQLYAEYIRLINILKNTSVKEIVK